jgi:hypothetical protein
MALAAGGYSRRDVSMEPDYCSRRKQGLQRAGSMELDSDLGPSSVPAVAFAAAPTESGDSKGPTDSKEDKEKKLQNDIKAAGKAQSLPLVIVSTANAEEPCEHYSACESRTTQTC